MLLRRFLIVIAAALALLGGLLFLITLTPVVRLGALAMDQDWYDGKGEVLVVLGGSMLVPGTGRNATLGEDTYLRCVYASWILQTRRFRYIVVTGGDGMAQAMAKFLVQNGASKSSILVEDAAMSTYQNGLYTKRLLERQYGGQHIPPVVVLTSDYHSWRARRTFEHCGLTVKMISIPDVIKRSSSLSYRWTGAITLLSELGKNLFYMVTSKA